MTDCAEAFVLASMKRSGLYAAGQTKSQLNAVDSAMAVVSLNDEKLLMMSQQAQKRGRSMRRTACLKAETATELLLQCATADCTEAGPADAASKRLLLPEDADKQPLLRHSSCHSALCCPKGYFDECWCKWRRNVQDPEAG